MLMILGTNGGKEAKSQGIDRLEKKVNRECVNLPRIRK